MNNPKFLSYAIFFVFILVLSYENIALFRKLSGYKNSLALCNETVKQLQFNVDNYSRLHTVFENLRKDNSALESNDTVIVFCFSKFSCMDCVNYELMNNLNNLPITIISDFASEYEKFKFEKTYPEKKIIQSNQFYAKNTYAPYYAVLIGNELHDFFSPNININIETKKFLIKYGNKKKH